MHLRLNEQGTWNLEDMKPDEVALLFRVVDDETTRCRRSKPCKDHTHHAAVVILRSVLIEGGLREQLPPSPTGVTVDV